MLESISYLINRVTPLGRIFKVIEGGHLLRWCYALLLIKLGCLLWFDGQTQPLLEGLVLQHQCRPEPEVVSFSQVLQHTGSHGDWWDALGHGFYKAVQCAGLTVSLYLMTATAQEGADLPRQSLEPKTELFQVFIQNVTSLNPGVLLHTCNSTQHFRG